MSMKNGHPFVDLTGKIYRVQPHDNARMKPGYMQGRLKEGDLVLCLERQHAKVHRYAPLWCDATGIRAYPEAFWFLSEPIGEPIASWQPTVSEFHRLWGGMNLKGQPTLTEWVLLQA